MHIIRDSPYRANRRLWGRWHGPRLGRASSRIWSKRATASAFSAHACARAVHSANPEHAIHGALVRDILISTPRVVHPHNEYFWAQNTVSGGGHGSRGPGARLRVLVARDQPPHHAELGAARGIVPEASRGDHEILVLVVALRTPDQIVPRSPIRATTPGLPEYQARRMINSPTYPYL